jgi:hypothetical protein
MLLDPDSFDLVQDVEAILTDMSGNELEHGSRGSSCGRCSKLPRPCAGAPPMSSDQLRTLRGYVAEPLCRDAAWWQEAVGQ